jgi:hypothetical protein
MLTLVSKHVIPFKKNYGLFVCDCGNLSVVNRACVTRGNTGSCGCLRREMMREKSTSHGKCGTKVYRTWKAMRNRCLDESSARYSNYGGRGITICERWSLFENFYEDMGDPPSPDHSLDRIDNNGPYCKDNCRWATRDQQANNKQATRLITHEGQTMSMAQWDRFNGWRVGTVGFRLNSGWSAEDAVSVPLGERRCR